MLPPWNNTGGKHYLVIGRIRISFMIEFTRKGFSMGLMFGELFSG